MLAFACAFTMFAGAAFTDQADFAVDSDVVNTLVSLGVIEGYEDGSFRPDDTVTRAEMAKMIYVVRTGRSDASAYNDDATSFTDIDSHWARGYIKYCQSLGIIAGKSATIFDPDSTVTTQEAAKMLLVTLGYDAETAGLVGAGWGTKTNALADENGLLKDVNNGTTQGLPRQYAAQIIYNAINAYTVVYRDGAYTNWTSNGDEHLPTVGERYMDLVKVTGTLVASGKVGLNGAGAEEELVLENLSDADIAAGKESSFNDVTEDYSDMLGQKVQVLYKENNDDVTVYGVFATDDNEVLIETTANELDTVSEANKIKVNGTNYTVDMSRKYDVTDGNLSLDQNGTAGLPIYTVAASGTGAAVSGQVVESADLNTTIDALNNNGVDVTVISNDGDSKIDMIIVFDQTFAKLTAVNSSSVTYREVALDMSGSTTSNGAKLDLEDDAPSLYDGYAKDDYVFVSVDLYNDAIVIEKADVITGSAEATKADSIRMDGTWYDYYMTTGSFNAKSGNSYNVYVLNGYAYYIEGSAATDVDTLLVKSVGDYNKMNEGVEAKVLKEDGTEEIINVERLVIPGAGFDQDAFDEDNTAAENNATVYAGQTDDSDISKELDANTNLIKTPGLYTFDQDGSDYTLFEVNSNYASGSKIEGVLGNNDYTSKTETIDGNDVDDAAVIYLNYNNGDDWRVITGEALAGYDDITGTGNTAYIADDGTIVAAFLYSSAKLSTTDTLYGVVTSSYIATNSDGDRVVYLEMITPEGTQTVETEETRNSFSKGDIVSFTGSYEQAVGTVTVESDTQTSGTQSQGFIAVDRISSNDLVTPKTTYNDGDTDYTITEDIPDAGKIVSDTTVIYIDQDNSTYEYVEDDDIAEAVEYGTNGIYANAYVIVDDNELDLIVYAVNGQIRDGSDTFKLLDARKTSDIAAEEAANEAIADAKSAVDTAAKAATSASGDGTQATPYKFEVTNTDGASLELLAFAATDTTVTVNVTDQGTTTADVAYNEGALVATATTIADGTLKFTVTIDNELASVDPTVLYFEVTLV